MPTVWRTRSALPHFIQYPLESAVSASVTLACEVYSDNGSYPTITAASIDIVRPDGVAAVSDQVVTVSGASLSYAWTLTAASETLSTGYQVRWRFTVSSVQYQIIERAFICRHIPYLTVTEAELLERHPELADLRPQTQESWDATLNSAWETVQRRLIQQGRRPWLVVEPDALHEPVLLLALSRCFRACSTFTGNTSRYAELAKEYDEAYTAEWGRLSFTYDDDDDGLGGSDEEAVSGQPVIFLSNSPTRLRYR